MVKQLAEQQENNTNQKDKEIVLTTVCVGSLGIILIIIGIICAKAQLLWGSVIIAIGLVVIRAAYTYLLSKHNNKKNKE